MVMFAVFATALERVYRPIHAADRFVLARIRSRKDSIKILRNDPELKDIWSGALGSLECEMGETQGGNTKIGDVCIGRFGSMS